MNAAKRERFLSLDVFRGMTVALMILVNNPGTWDHIYEPLDHAPWVGCTFADLVFPFFLFAVGNALAFVMPGLENAGTPVFLKKVIKRSLIIFLIGLGLNWLPFFKWDDNNQLVFKIWENVRIMGVLQRIAIVYLLASLVVYFFKLRGALITSAIILLAYTGVCVYSHAHIHENLFGANVDRAILGESHMLKELDRPFDPEGLATSFAPIVQVIFGYLAGWFIQRKGKNMQMIKQLFLYGLAFFALGAAWHLVSPISKKVWTSSYVVFTTGLAGMLISAFIYLIEMKNIHGFLTRFFEAFGKNPLFIFVLSGVIPRVLRLIRIPAETEDGKPEFIDPLTAFYRAVCRPLFSDERNASLLYAIIVILFMGAIAIYMNKKKIYIKV